MYLNGIDANALRYLVRSLGSSTICDITIDLRTPSPPSCEYLSYIIQHSMWPDWRHAFRRPLNATRRYIRPELYQNVARIELQSTIS